MACRYILIIEDDEGIRETLAELLGLSGFTVATAKNGKEGLALLAERDAPCLILLDLMMPIMNGWEFLEILEKEHQHVLATIPVTITSAALDVTHLQQRYGCSCLKKPVGLERLVTLAKEHCGERGQ